MSLMREKWKEKTTVNSNFICPSQMSSMLINHNFSTIKVMVNRDLSWLTLERDRETFRGCYRP